jgi:hypothetical protein
MAKPEVLNILVDNILENSESSLSPTISWQYYDVDNDAQQTYELKVGTCPGESDIYDSGTVASSDTSVVLPLSGYTTLKNGLKYYVTLVVTNSSETSESKESFFCTEGIYWNSHVDNAIGWSVEFYFRLDETYGQIIDFDETTHPHHDVEIKDGTRTMSIEFYVDRILVKTSETDAYFINTTKFNLYRIVGENDDVKLYINGTLALNILEKNTLPSTSKTIRFGTTTNTIKVSSTWSSISMDLEGAKSPSDLMTNSEVTSFLFDDEEIVSSLYDFGTQNDVLVATNPENENLSGKIYSVSKKARAQTYQTEPVTNIESDQILLDRKGVKFASSLDRLYKIKGEKIVNFDFDADLDDEGNLLDFSRVENCLGICATDSNLLRIDTTSESSDAFWYYETVQNNSNLWFAEVDNSRGWVVETKVRVANDGSNPNQSAGIIINDGKYQETVWLYTNKIVLENTNQTAYVDLFTKAKDLRVTGKFNDIKVFLKESDGWRLVIDGTGAFKTEAQTYANTGRPRIAQAFSNQAYATFHSNKSGDWQIHVNNFDGQDWQLEKQLTFDEGDSLNPSLVVGPNNHAHIAYETNRFGSSEIIYIRYNGFAVVDKVRITNSVGDSTNPEIAVLDNGNIHIVWLDNRNGTKEVFGAYFDADAQSWQSSNFDVEDIEISNYMSASSAGLSLVANGNNLGLVWHDDRNVVNNIFFSEFNSGWGVESLVSPMATPSVNPDITIDSSGTYHIVWEDARLGVTNIFHKSYSGSLSVEAQVSSTSEDSKRPSISAIGEELNVFWLEESGAGHDILLGRKKSIWESSGNSGTDYVFSNTEVDNVTALDSFVFADRREVMISYLSESGGEFNTSYSYSRFIAESEAASTEDIALESFKISNSKETKKIAFGDISDADKTISEWENFKYHVERCVDPVIVEYFNFNKIRNIFIDNERNLYVLDYDGLHIYNLFVDSDDLVSNEVSKSAANSAPTNGDKVFVTNSGHIFLSRGRQLFYHLPLFSPDVDFDNMWLQIDVQYSLGNITAFGQDPEEKVWVGFDQGAVSFNLDDVFANNILNSENSTLHASGSGVTSFAYDSLNSWASLDASIAKIRRTNNSEVILKIADGLIDKDIGKIITESDVVQWAFGPKGLVKINDGNVEVFRDKTMSNNINDIVLDGNGGLWISSDVGVEYFDDENNVNYLISSADGLVPPSIFLDRKAYRILSPEPINERFYSIVRVNEIFRDPSLYILDGRNKLIIFNEAQTSNTTVEFVYFDQVQMMFDFNNLVLSLEVGTSSPIRIVDLARGNSDNEFFVVFNIDGNIVTYRLAKTGTVETVHPFGTIVFDKTPPIGTIDIVDQISASQVILDLNASDNISGVDQMIVSNFSNFTSDGNAPLTPVPFTRRVTWDLGNTIGIGVQNHAFIGTTGSILHGFSRNVNNEAINDVLAGSSNAAQIYKFDPQGRIWNNVENLAAEQVLSMETYLGRVYVGTGDSGKIFVSENGETYTLLTQLSDPYVYSLLAASDNRLYIGTGDAGKIYVYDGTSTNLLFDLGEDNIYSMMEFAGFIYMGTGEKGRIYRYNLASENLEIIFDEVDPQITSLAAGTDFNSQSETVFAGTFDNGKILRLVGSRDLFVKSFETTASKVHSMKTIVDGASGSIIDTYACVDDRLFKLGQNSWDIVHVDPDGNDILDIEVVNGELFIITSSTIKSVSLSTDKFVYVKFIDFAGNETILFDENGDLKPRTDDERLFDVVTVEELAGFSLQNRLLIVDASGNVLKTVAGSRPYLTAGRIDVEKAVYDSQIFDGTNNLVSWDQITWSGTVPTNTEIQLQIRTADTETEIVDKDFSEFVSNGEDLSGLSGRFIQFRATLSSSARGITPVLNNVTITSKSTFAVHYFTTNFALPSNLKSGILTENSVTPEGTEIIFGINTNTSTNWTDYQIIEPNKVFFVENTNIGENLRVGVKFLSTNQDVSQLDEFGLMFATDNGDLVKLNI